MKKLFLIASVLLAACVVSCKKETPVEDAVTLKSPASVTVPVTGDVVSISFNSSVAWTATSSQTWLSLSPASGAAGDVTIKASAVKNETYDARTAEVTITAGTKTAKVTVTQGQVDAVVVKETSFELPAEGGEIDIPVAANVDVTVTIPEAIDWVHMTPPNKGLVDSVVKLYVDPSTDLEAREATIKVGATDVKIAQAAFNAYFDFEGDYSAIQYGGRLTVPQEGGTFVIEVATNLDWRTHYDEEWPPEDVSWLDFVQKESSIEITVRPNEGFLARDNWIYVNAAEELYGDVFGGYFQVYQEGIPAPVTPELVWTVNLLDDESYGYVNFAYNRLAFTESGALLLSDCDQVRAINPADGSLWRSFTFDGVSPYNICNDDAGNIIVVEDFVADMDWDSGVLISGTEFKAFYTKDVNEPLKEIVLPNNVYGTIGGFRARGDLATKGSITGVAAGASYWIGFDIANYEAQPNYYGVENSGAGAGPNAFWSPASGAAIAYGDDLHDGLLFRAYDGAESVYYRHDAYTPQWAAEMAGIEYEPWTLVSAAGAGGNENQANMDVIDYNGKKILAMTQGYHFTWAGFNADIYVLDITNIDAPELLATVNTEEWINNEWPNGQIGADVLLREGDGCLELYAVHSGLCSLAKFVFNP